MDETRQRVLEAMTDLGYIYNRAAASLRSKRSGAIGVIVTDIRNPFFAQMVVSSETALEEVDCTVVLGNSSDALHRQERLLETMHGYAVDGLLFCPATHTSVQTIERLRSWRLPFVFITRYLRDLQADYVGADNIAGAREAAGHLIRNGHRRIAFLGGPIDSSARQDRYRGYAEAHAEHGLGVDAALSITSPVTLEGGRQALAQVLQVPAPPTAALCYNDVVAFGAMLGLQAGGRRPGMDFDVIGFDDIEEASLWQPGLTTVSIDTRRIGAEAVKLLLERIAQPDGPPQQIILPPRLVIRESCAACITHEGGGTPAATGA
jgi:LacI family transcriptional regulator